MDAGGNNIINNSDTSKNNSSTPYFHSVHLNKTKASEKKEYFTNIKKESKLKKNLEANLKKGKEVFSKEKIREAKANVKKIDIKKLLIKIGIVSCALVVIFMTFFFITKYLPTDKSQADAELLMDSDPEAGINVYDKLILYAKSKEEKAALLMSKATALFKVDPVKYKKTILSDLHKAEDLISTKATAYKLAGFEEYYGNGTESEKWKNIAESRPFSEGDKYDN